MDSFFYNENQLLYSSNTSAWYFYFLISLFIAYAVARTFLGRITVSTFNAVLRYNSSVSMYNDNSQLQQQRDLVLYAFYFICMSFYAMLIMEQYKVYPIAYKGLNLLLFSVLVLLVIFIARIVLLNILGHVFEISTLLQEYLYHGFTYNKLMGIVFLPTNFLIVYSEGVLHIASIYVSFIILSLLLLFKIVRAITFSLKKRVLNFYLFLYLCALEIVPLLLIVKWVTKLI